MDVLHDSAFRKWARIATLVGQDKIPPYVLECTPMDEKTASNLSDALFADPVTRLLPIDSPASTWLAAAYCALDRPSQPGIFENIKRAAAVYGITADVQRAEAAIAAGALTKSAEAQDDNYGWLIKNAAGGVTDRRYPMFDAEGVRKAAAYFEANRSQYATPVRLTIASSILRKAAEYSVDIATLPSCLEREAGMGFPRRSVLMHELNERAELSKDAENGALLANVTRLVGVASEEELAANMDKIASILDTFDAAENLTPWYGKRITYPADILYGVSIKEASAFMQRAIKLCRYTFDIEKLAKELPYEMVEAVLGEKRAKAASDNGKLTTPKLAAVLNSASQADRAAFEDGILAVCGE